MSKIGRNDPCPCGSGKKYKKCCLNRGVELPADFPYIKQYPQEDENQSIVMLTPQIPNEDILKLEKKILEYIKKNHPACLQDAKDNVAFTLFRLLFLGYKQESVDNFIEQASKPFIIPWVLYNWVPDLFDQIDQDRDEKDIQDRTMALAYSQQRDDDLTASDAALLDSLNKTYFSYYEVKKIEKDGSMVIIDLLFDSEHTIVDTQLSATLKAGDIIFSRIVCHQGKEVVYGIWPMAIPAIYSERINDFKEKCIELNHNQPLVSRLFRTRFEFDLRDILSIIIVTMIEHNRDFMKR